MKNKPIREVLYHHDGRRMMRLESSDPETWGETIGYLEISATPNHGARWVCRDRNRRPLLVLRGRAFIFAECDEAAQWLLAWHNLMAAGVEVPGTTGHEGLTPEPATV